MGQQYLKSKSGFTLIELLVVISIISILSSVVLANLSSARAKARDAKRQSDLTQLRVALEFYYDSNGSYPVGCWNYFEAQGVNYIPGLSPTYISQLPRDSLSGQSCPGGIGDNSNWRTYYYCSNGAAYKANVCSESVVPVNSVWYDLFRPGYAWMICSGTPACATF
ncbi:MAG: prepilin-type N-terminal cleavage/methylation domain-containing protein [Candidatus Zambryskibacteria bacterium]|nr:prepilin-type N-terminal cleavage/methylation domain-containing protein [Candidatus Zambryskibacteria bacterium]